MSESKERKVIKYGENEPETTGSPDASAEEAEVSACFAGQPGALTEEAESLSREEIDARLEERRSRRRAKQTRKKRITVLVMVLAFALLATMCGKDIVRLKAENVALKRQQAALKKERDELRAELENTSEQEYIRDQARKQLKLLNPGELLFVWDD